MSRRIEGSPGAIVAAKPSHFSLIFGAASCVGAQALNIYVHVLIAIVLVGAVAETFEAVAERRRRSRNREARKFPGLEDVDKKHRDGRSKAGLAVPASSTKRDPKGERAQPDKAPSPSGQIDLAKYRPVPVRDAQHDSLDDRTFPRSNVSEKSATTLKPGQDEGGSARPDASESSLMTPSLSDIRRQVGEMPAVEAVAYLLEVLANVMGDESGPVGDCPDLPLTPSEMVVFRRLYRSEDSFVTQGSLMNALYLNRADPPQEDAMRIMIMKLRHKLPTGFTIEAVWGQGYRLRRAEGAQFSWETRDPAAVGG
ncbi:winged helix-turn-helix domain-containing protein [Salipiger thiooxidans]|uniref:winged helix-turn-helix domain-containing protein n=1 Tax=Salipiger thiooxidans TaxID=282683 RepID=UPI001A8ED161|nr:winged helix-turn-helix domain-containing protein [Salipiger thiooxidans]MBN8188617.1 winged helix-turn-helix domain-containing protein [Salipiger thiooxidans]